MKILAAPDSFKGSLASPAAAEAMRRGIKRAAPACDVVCLPLADGGEGTLDALLSATASRRVPQTVRGPLGHPIDTYYGLLGTHTAIVEMASAAGLSLVPIGIRDPRKTSTYGVGELIRAALHSGASHLIVALGGSATNDGGAGALQALGVQFYDTNGALIPPGIPGGDLIHIARMDISRVTYPAGRTVTLASDVVNPLLGPGGATAIYGPQKGATPAIVRELEAGLSHFAHILELGTGNDVSLRPGAGAAGGLGAGLMACLSAQMQSGIDLVLDAAGFDTHARDANFVFTGEGKIDTQTLHGKTILGLLSRCRALDVPLIAFGGSVDIAAADALFRHGLRAAFPIVSSPISLNEAMARGAELLEEAAERVTRGLMAKAPRP